MAKETLTLHFDPEWDVDSVEEIEASTYQEAAESLAAKHNCKVIDLGLREWALIDERGDHAGWISYRNA